jgi:hypothetical protein
MTLYTHTPLCKMRHTYISQGGRGVWTRCHSLTDATHSVLLAERSFYHSEPFSVRALRHWYTRCASLTHRLRDQLIAGEGWETAD